jgi:hypothetical protein
LPNRDCIAFYFQDAAVTVREVLRAAHFRGDLKPAIEGLARKLDCSKEAMRLSLEGDEEVIDEMINHFRYENDLISAEETEAWLEARGLESDEFQEFFDRCYWTDILKGKVFRRDAEGSHDTVEIMANLEAEVLISGGFGPLAVDLSRRLMVRNDSESRATVGEIETALRRFHDNTGIGQCGLESWLTSLDRNQAWFNEMLEMEAAYQKRCESILTPGQLARELASSRLSLTRMEIECIEFDGIDAAREGLLCVRDDGLSLEEVARESRYPYKRSELLAADLPEELRQILLCAKIGDVLEPSGSGELMRLYRVLRKEEPELHDPSVLSRIEQKVLQAHFSGAKAGEFRWIIK